MTARWILLIALPLAASAPTLAWAEGGAASAETAKAPEATKVATRKEEVVHPSHRVAHPSRRKEDARHCLDLKGNIAIIKCAEQYL